MIELAAVSKAFNQGRPNELWALREVSLSLPPARITVFRGPSGSGKTTLVSLIGCLARPTAGRVHVDGRPVSGLPERFLTEVRRRTFGFVFQRFHLIRGLSVLENVMLPAYPLGLPHRELTRAALTLLARFDLEHKARARVEWLSGGEAQRAAIARALINDPRVLIADEPTANLDSARSRDFMAIVGNLQAEGKTVLIASHDPLVFESAAVAQVVSLLDGRVEAVETCS